MDASVRKGQSASQPAKRDRTSIRSIFGRWLGIAVAVALAVSAFLNYSNVSVAELASAEKAMRAELDYLTYQIDRGGQGSAGDYLHGYTGDKAGIVLLTDGTSIIESNDERLASGQRLDDVFGDKALAAIDASCKKQALQSLSFKPQDGTKPEAACLLAGRTSAGTVVIILPEKTIYADRIVAMGTATLSSALLLLALYVTVRLLLRVVVVSRIDETNETLAHITAGDLDARVRVYGSKEFQSLSNGINETVDALNGWIAEANARMESELAAAKDIQESTLPRDFPPFPEIGHFDLYALMDPAREVGGDFYDFFLLEGSNDRAGKLVFIVADVSGKGIPAALFMMEAKSQIRGHIASGLALAEAIASVNDLLCEDNAEGMFVTAWVGVLDYESWRVEYVNAGHNPPLLCHEGSWEWLTERSGLPLGFFEGMAYKSRFLDCSRGDKLFLYSDGVSEAMDVDGKLYGGPRLESLLQTSAELSPRELVDTVRADVATYATGAEQSDDITILALDLGAAPVEE